MNVLFFIDENSEIQIVHTQSNFRNAVEQHNSLGEMNNYYRLHIKTKIGYPKRDERHQVKVTYVKNMLTYEDTRFVGKGLIEYFVKSD